MQMRKSIFAFALCAVFCATAEVAVQKDGNTRPAATGRMPDVKEIVLPGEYPGHLQDCCWDGREFIYWAHTWQIIKTDLRGNIVAKIDAEWHNAGCELKDGVLYVAVCPTAEPHGGKILPWGPQSQLQVNEYDAQTLQFRKKHLLPVADRAGSLAVLKDGSFVVGCLRPGDITPSQVRFHHLSADLQLLSTHLLDHVKVKMGIETIHLHDGILYMSCYGGPTLLVDPKTLKETGRVKSLGGEKGIIFDGEYRWIGVTKKDPQTKQWRSKLVRVKK